MIHLAGTSPSGGVPSGTIRDLNTTEGSTMHIEILHERDPDSACGLTFWIDGVRYDGPTDDLKIEVEDLDPGAGYEREDWESSRRYALDVPGRSDAFKVALDEAYDLHGENKYITD